MNSNDKKHERDLDQTDAGAPRPMPTGYEYIIGDFVDLYNKLNPEARVTLQRSAANTESPQNSQASIVLLRADGTAVLAGTGATQKDAEAMFIKNAFALLTDTPVARLYITDNGPEIVNDKSMVQALCHARGKRTAEYTFVTNK